MEKRRDALKEAKEKLEEKKKELAEQIGDKQELIKAHTKNLQDLICEFYQRSNEAEVNAKYYLAKLL